MSDNKIEKIPADGIAEDVLVSHDKEFGEVTLMDGDSAITLGRKQIRPLIDHLELIEFTNEQHNQKQRPEKVHIDDWLMHIPKDDNERYAQWVLHNIRLPAIFRSHFNIFTRDQKLFCTYDKKRWRVTYASRMGDLCLSRDFNREAGYETRGVCVTDCSEWSDTPDYRPYKVEQ